MRCSFKMKCFHSRNYKLLIKAFKTYVRPILEYGTILWSPTNIGDINTIENIQKSFTHIVVFLFKLPLLSYLDKLELSNLKRLELRRIHFISIELFKIVNGWFSYSCFKKYCICFKKYCICFKKYCICFKKYCICFKKYCICFKKYCICFKKYCICFMKYCICFKKYIVSVLRSIVSVSNITFTRGHRFKFLAPRFRKNVCKNSYCRYRTISFRKFYHSRVLILI